MKNIELLGLSLITAALVMTTGCSDDDDKDSGPSAPSEFTKGVELNTSVTTNAMALISSAMDNAMSKLAPSRLAPKMSATKIARSSESENSSITTPCEVSGSYTYERVYTTTGDHEDQPDESWSEKRHNSISYDNCVDNYSGVNFIGESLDQVVRNGVGWDEGPIDSYREYNKDSNRSKQEISGSMNYSEVYRSSTTKATITTLFDLSYRQKIAYDGTDLDRDDINISHETTENGTMELYQTNAAGERIAGVGERVVYGDIRFTGEQIATASKTTTVSDMNGFAAAYETNSTGEHVVSGKYYNNYHVGTVKVGDEQNTTVSGTIGGSCLGGSVTVAVDPVIRDNEVIYGEDQLPYAGKATLTGSNTATITFSVVSETPPKTQATVQVDDGPLTQFDDWASLATGECQDD